LQASRGQIRTLPVLAEIQALPSEAKPITSFGDPHEGWTEVAERLYEIVEKLKETKHTRGASL